MIARNTTSTYCLTKMYEAIRGLFRTTGNSHGIVGGDYEHAM